MTFVELFEYSLTVRGYHNYRDYLHPQGEQKLLCFHEKDKAYNFLILAWLLVNL